MYWNCVQLHEQKFVNMRVTPKCLKKMMVTPTLCDNIDFKLR